MTNLEVQIKKMLNPAMLKKGPHGFFIVQHGIGGKLRGVIEIRDQSQSIRLYYLESGMGTGRLSHELAISTDETMVHMIAEAIVYSPGPYSEPQRTTFLNAQLDYPITVDAFMACHRIIRASYQEGASKMMEEMPDEDFYTLYFDEFSANVLEKRHGINLSREIKTIQKAIDLSSS